MCGRLVLFSALILALAGPARGDEARRPIARAGPALAEISAQPAGSRLVRLPSLEFPFSIEPRCEAGTRLVSVSISIADTQKSFVAADFAEGPLLETTMLLPQRQLGPLATGQFCAADGLGPDDAKVLRIEDAFTASVSLRCANDARQTMNFETLPLEVRLSCKTTVRDDPMAADKEGRQEPSPPMTRF